MLTRLHSRTRTGLPLHLVAALPLFLCYYAVSNLSAVADDPRALGPMFGSLAQFTLPFGAAIGLYLALSPAPLGLRVLERLSRRRSAVDKLRRAALWILLTVILLVLYALPFLLLSTTADLPPQLTAAQFLYPIAAAVLGIGIGLGLGLVVEPLVRIRRSSDATAAALVFGVLVFLGFVIQGDWRPQLSLAVGSKVFAARLDPNWTLVWLQIGLAIAGGVALAAIGISVYLMDRRRSILVLGGAILSLGIAGAAFSEASDQPLANPRHADDAVCQRESVEICYWEEDSAGAQRLSASMAAIQARIPAQYFPSVVASYGMENQVDNPKAVFVDSMPRNRRLAAVYAGELVAKSAGCTPESVDNYRQVANLIQTIAKVVYSNTPIDPEAFVVLDSCR